MDSAKWQKIKTLLSAALDLPENERDEFFANENDAEIRAEVEKLLFAEANAKNFINEPILIQNGFVNDESKDNLIGETIENYRILERIGTGGMGAVYLAERLNSDFKQKVALKIIKRGMDSEAILQRFAIERRILSTLKHPNIAQLLDGGFSAQGLSFFVMEFVDGTPLNQFCDENTLSLNERLELFVQICGAVEHAHKNLIVHRDLKPSNILVTNDGIPKLLDFGISKLLSNDEDEATLTATQGRVFTPEYASPEQILGKPVSTATDVYSLGVILYELLSGHRPYETKGKSFDEIVKNVCETEPTKPSVAITKFKFAETHKESKNPKSKIQNPKSLQGDLDNIILKALRKEPLERYGSVQQFAEDISRFLRGLPVLARPNTLNYRFGKYVKRHKAGVLAATLVLVSLVGGISVATWQAVEARRERANAEQRFNDVRKLANSVIFDYHDEIEKLPGSTAIREKIVKDAAEYLDRLATEKLDDVTLQIELASAYDRLGDIEGNFFNASFANSVKAKEFYQKGLTIRETLFSVSPNDANLKSQLALSHAKLADLEFGNGNQPSAVKHYQKAISFNEQVIQIDPNDEKIRYQLAKAYRNLGVRGRSPQNTEASLELVKKAITILESLLAQNPNNLNYLESKGDAFEGIAAILETNLERRRESIEAYNFAIILRRELAEKNPHIAILQQKYAMAYSYLGDTYYELSERDNAVKNYRKCLEILDKAVEKDSKNEQIKQDQAAVRGSLAFTLTEQGDFIESLEVMKKVVVSLETKYAKDSDDLTTHFRIAMAKEGLGKAFENSAKSAKSTTEKISDYQNALTNFEQSLKIYKVYEGKSGTFPSVNVNVEEAIEAVNNSIKNCQENLNLLQIKK